MKKTMVCLFVTAGLFFFYTLQARALQLVMVSLSRSVSSEMLPQDVTDHFSRDAEIIHAVAVFSDIREKVVVQGSWVSVDAIETPNYSIDSSEVTLLPGEARAHFQITKPTNGWPIGEYKLTLSVNGVLVSSTPFRVVESSDKKQPTSIPLGREETKIDTIVGGWRCRIFMGTFAAGESKVGFQANGQATVDGRSFLYELLPGNILRLQDGMGGSEYTYKLNNGKLDLSYADGSSFSCVPEKQREKSSPESTVYSWPSEYGKPENQTHSNGGWGAAVPGASQQAPGNWGSGGAAYGSYNQGNAMGTGLSGTGREGLIRGTFCHYSGSSSYYSSSDYSGYSHTNTITFDGQGRWRFGSESYFSSDAGLYANTGGAGDSGTYRVVGQQIEYRTNSGEQGRAQIKMQQNDGRITEIIVDGELYSPALCE